MTTHKTPQQVADEKRDRDDEAYWAMMQTVRDEMAEECAPWQPSGRDVHEEAIKRLKQDQTDWL